MDRPTLIRKKSQHDVKGEFYRCDYLCDTLSVVVIGASGDLAKKKTYPSLFALFRSSYLPEHVQIVGYARSQKTDKDFRATLRDYLAAKCDDDEVIDAFLKKCFYRSGGYDDETAIEKVAMEMAGMEQVSGHEVANRLFYFAIPPSLFTKVAGALKAAATNHNGWSRFIVEKPFGSDLESFETLHESLSDMLEEKETYRIDHYIGKEAVQNLLVMRFANSIFEPLWNRNHIASVVISFKEDFGTKGRGGYFDKSGIIRDVMQNHLMQVLTMFAMEAPARQSGDYIRNEKVKVLQAIPPIRIEDCITGQYISDDEGIEQAYIDDDGVPDDSKTPTFAALVMYINNPRWDGVPFIMRAGKALNERKSEVRIQFKRAPGSSLLFPDTGNGSTLSRNELVMRLQPNEAVYMKMNIKSPGLAGDPVMSELDLSYKTRFPDKFSDLPDAYTRLMLQVLRGDSSAFVRDDELREAWKIFTPLLHAIDDGKIEPIKYKAFSRGPAEFDEMAERHGYVYSGEAYDWNGTA
ncbi:glucose 6 phosphate 1 dehydrogenase [Chondrus crispus]|uniref:Glucose-6-phosphate 1-dehydrogenase n=1 Tax=Chondrus crispus TaxID=2769 RepID=R7QIH9_CHOCR|nr:glucose 6 phosphate 1 dehydrogenase [Chondrus crispus]CDF37879.1 glucose 6 phosphate 1 dehydrogenase [Chondrus crispus]|eukprot:XP_005717750.1 glucose 6 phosphate 1 dehydrogenase [Chondrus crispus]